MAKQYWKIQKDALVWRVAPNDPHTDNVEMSGLYVDEVLYYGVREDDTLALGAHMFFPMLRTIPKEKICAYGRGTKGVYLSKCRHDAPDELRLRAKETATISIVYTAEIAKALYAVAGVPDRVALVTGDGGHRFYADDAYPVLHKMLKG